MPGSLPWRAVQGLVAAVVFSLLLYVAVGLADSGTGLLHPLPLLAILWAVLIPFRNERGHVTLLTVACAITLVHALSTTGALLAPFVLAVVLAYVLDPLVDRLEARKLPRVAAIFLLTLPALAALMLLVVVALPQAIRHVGGVVQELPGLLDGLKSSARAFLLANDLPVVDEASLVARLDTLDSRAVVSFAAERQEALLSWLWYGVLGLGRGIGTLVTLVGFTALTPVLTFYILRDWDRLTSRASSLIPADRRKGAVAFVKDCDRIVARYLRGQIVVAVLIGLLTAVGLWLFRFPYAGTLGLIVGVFSVVPYLGLILSLIPALIIALTSDSVGGSLLAIAVVYGGTQALEGTVISPKVVGDSVGLHPVWVVLSLALGGFFFGFVGLLIAVPAAAVGRLLVVHLLDRYRESEFYRGPMAETHLAPTRGGAGVTMADQPPEASVSASSSGDGPSNTAQGPR